MTDAARLAFRTCPLCEAACGLEVAVRRDADGSETIARIRGDRDDVFSAGFLCPKGPALKQLHEDPDRVRRPLVKRDGRFVEVGWAEAWATTADGLAGVIERHGRDAVASYLGNPSYHSLGALLYSRSVTKAIGSVNRYSVGSVDQRPKEVAAGLLFGEYTAPVPDIDRTMFLLCLGANPFESNGSMASAPDWPGRLRRLMERGGRLVVVDPRRTRTAAAASQWIPIRPGTDALFLAAIARVMFDEQLIDLGDVADHVSGLRTVDEALREFSPEVVTTSTGVPASTIRVLARELAAAPAAAVYGRVGTCTQQFGSLASWLIDVLNVISGNLDRPGGAMFSLPATGASNTRGRPGVGNGLRFNRYGSRCHNRPEVMGELPVAALAEEIETAGPGQVRAIVVIGGNPVLSNPAGPRLAAALDDLEFMVAVDFYVNESTHHADVLLPVPSAMQKPHFDVGLLQFSLRNVANWSDPVLRLDDGQLDEWEVLLMLAHVARGGPPEADIAALDDAEFEDAARHAPTDIAEAVRSSGRRGPARLVDLMLRTGPYALTLDDLLAAPHGIDLGALQPRIPEILRTPSGCIELAPPELLGDVDRLTAFLHDEIAPAFPLVLIGRRDLRSNNSWMHNVEVLVRGRPRCLLEMHPVDAAACGAGERDLVTVTSATGQVAASVSVTDVVSQGVVSLPHGWGHDVNGVAMQVARIHAGVNVNALADAGSVDVLSGTSVFNGIPVRVDRASFTSRNHRRRTDDDGLILGPCRR